MSIRSDLEITGHVGFENHSGKSKVMTDWKAIINDPKTKGTHDSLVCTIYPHEVLMLLRTRKYRSMEYDTGNFSILKQMDKQNLVRYKTALGRLNAIHLHICKANIMRKKFKLQPGVMGLSVNGIPIDISIYTKIKSKGYLSGLHLRMDVNEPLGIAKRDIGNRMKYYYELAADIWPALSQDLIPPFVGSENQTTSQDFDKYKPEPIIKDPLQRLRYMYTFNRPNLFGTEQDVVVSYALLCSKIPLKSRRFRLITHERSHYDFMNANKSESKSLFKAIQIEKTIKNTSEGGDIGEYKQLLWGPKSKSLIGNFTSHQQIKDLELIVVGYIDGKHKNNHSLANTSSKSISSISNNEYELFEIDSHELPIKVRENAPNTLANYYIQTSDGVNTHGAYVVVLAEHLEEITEELVEKELRGFLTPQQRTKIKELLNQEAV